VPPERHFQKLVGDRLRSSRLRQGITQRELARRVAGGLDLSYIGRIERGEQLPSLKVLHKLGRALGVSLSEFFRGGPAEPVPAVGRVRSVLWRALQGVPPADVPILLGVARLLARRRATVTRYRRGRGATRMAAEEQPRYRRRRTSSRSSAE